MLVLQVTGASNRTPVRDREYPSARLLSIIKRSRVQTGAVALTSYGPCSCRVIGWQRLVRPPPVSMLPPERCATARDGRSTIDAGMIVHQRHPLLLTVQGQLPRIVQPNPFVPRGHPVAGTECTEIAQDAVILWSHTQMLGIIEVVALSILPLLSQESHFCRVCCL
jgi:hypothetical protein